MLPYFVFDHFNIGPVRINVWGFFVGLAFVAGYFFTLYQARKKSIPPEKILWLSLAIFLGAGLGSRVGYLLQFPSDWLANFSLLWEFNGGGLMLWSGILGAILGGWLYLKIIDYSSSKAEGRVEKLAFWRMADLVAPAIVLGIGIGRLGCFLINDHLGAPTDLPWGILWPDGVVRQPVALYESLAGFVLFLLSLLVERKIISGRRGPQLRAAPSSVIPSSEPGSRILDSRFRSPRLRLVEAGGNNNYGMLFLLFLASYSAFRFLLDFLRASSGILADPRWWGLTTSQWISLAVVIFSVFVLILKKKNYEK